MTGAASDINGTASEAYLVGDLRVEVGLQRVTRDIVRTS